MSGFFEPVHRPNGRLLVDGPVDDYEWAMFNQSRGRDESRRALARGGVALNST
jgi:hypothetical protein